MTEFWQPGDRLRLVSMPDDPNPIPSGSEGTVVAVRLATWQGKPCKYVDVDWDNGRGLSLVMPPDLAVKVNGEVE